MTSLPARLPSQNTLPIDCTMLQPNDGVISSERREGNIYIPLNILIFTGCWTTAMLNIRNRGRTCTRAPTLLFTQKSLAESLTLLRGSHQRSPQCLAESCRAQTSPSGGPLELTTFVFRGQSTRDGRPGRREGGWHMPLLVSN